MNHIGDNRYPYSHIRKIVIRKDPFFLFFFFYYSAPTLFFTFRGQGPLF